MRQQINLYQPKLGGEPTGFSAGKAALVFGFAIAGMAAYSIQSRLRVGQLEDQAAALRAEQTELEAKTAELGLAAAHAQPAEIDSRIKQLLHSVDARKRALEMLQAGAAGRTTGFAARLEALARGHVDGLWLDSVKLSGSNGSMNISGATLDADIVPVYLQSLARDAVLKGTRFDDFVIVRPLPSRHKSAQQDVSADEDDPADSKPVGKSTQQFTRFRIATHALTELQPVEDAT